MENKDICHTAPILQRRIQPEHKRQMDKGLHVLEIAKNYPSKTLTSIAAKIYNTQLFNRIEPGF